MENVYSLFVWFFGFVFVWLVFFFPHSSLKKSISV